MSVIYKKWKSAGFLWTPNIRRCFSPFSPTISNVRIGAFKFSEYSTYKETHSAAIITSWDLNQAVLL